MIYNVNQFLKKLSLLLLHGSINLNQAGKLSAQACGVSEKTVNRICKVAKLSGTNDNICFSTPGKETKQESKITGLDVFGKDVLRHIVFS